MSLYKVGTITAKIGVTIAFAKAQDLLHNALNVADKYSGSDRQQLIDALNQALQQLLH